ncbi:hypothetical protein DPMN_174095 [Dreissena polymorpha]|uniref:Uncharacterized protein n=1 Tax=Dreissena polymorpha TaxID=45954 RepID=A0A9D4E5E7_DREPO|nr:hypothetical protein DPMN_174095 [Dreissena polymorpha]
MQRACHPLFIVESSFPDLPEVPSVEGRESGTARSPVWRTYGADLGLGLGHSSAVPRTSRGWLREGPRDSGTQYAQRNCLGDEDDGR